MRANNEQKAKGNMQERISTEAIELRVEWLNKALGRATVFWVKREDDKGSEATDAFYVDHCYGGYRLECGGSPLFGPQRMSKRELCNQLEAILRAIKLARNETDGGYWPAEKSEVQS